MEEILEEILEVEEDTFTVIEFVREYVDTCRGCVMERYPANIKVEVAKGLREFFQVIKGRACGDNYGMMIYTLGEAESNEEGLIILKNGIPFTVEDLVAILMENEYNYIEAGDIIDAKVKYDMKHNRAGRY